MADFFIFFYTKSQKKSFISAKGNRTTGEITLTSDKDLMYGEKIYLTGVDAKNGISVQKELTESKLSRRLLC